MDWRGPEAAGAGRAGGATGALGRAGTNGGAGATGRAGGAGAAAGAGGGDGLLAMGGTSGPPEASGGRSGNMGRAGGGMGVGASGAGARGGAERTPRGGATGATGPRFRAGGGAGGATAGGAATGAATGGGSGGGSAGTTRGGGGGDTSAAAGGAGEAWESGMDSPIPARRRRSAIATSSSTELECVFFSSTPYSASISRMTFGLTSSSRASSLIRILLINDLKMGKRVVFIYIATLLLNPWREFSPVVIVADSEASSLHRFGSGPDNRGAGDSNRPRGLPPRRGIRLRERTRRGYRSRR